MKVIRSVGEILEELFKDVFLEDRINLIVIKFLKFLEVEILV